MRFRKLPPRLQGYILLHIAALALVLPAVGQPPNLTGGWLGPGLLLFAAVAGVWRIELTVLRGRQSLAFAAICLALLTEGLSLAALASAVGAVTAHLVRPTDAWWRLRYLQQPWYRRAFNVAHCVLATILAGLVWRGALSLAPETWLAKAIAVVLFAVVYFLLNSFGVATAVSLEQGLDPVRQWKEHWFWGAPCFVIMAVTAALIDAAYRSAGPLALLLLPSLYFVHRALRCYVETLKEQQKLAEEVSRLYQEQEEAGRRKDEFLATLAHELRNPLAPMRNTIALLGARSSDPVTIKSVELLDRQTRTLARLVDDLLDVSRITRGKIDLRPEPLDLRNLVELAVQTSQPLIAAKQHELRVSLPQEPLHMNADPTRLEQVITNLLNNAAKYTDPGGHIWLTVSKEEDQACVRVLDNGIGIPEDELPHVFELFTQVEPCSQRAQGGLGLGLTLVRRLVEMHGGSIEVFSAGHGRGSEFVARFPVTRREPAPEAVATGSRAAPLAVTPALEEVTRPALQVLVVDDNREAADTLQELLEMWGHHARVAYSGQGALAAGPEYRPDLILMDIGLPDLDGYQVASRLRSDPALRQVCLVAVTGFGQDSDRQRAKAAGFDDHLVKPADLKKLQLLLKRVASGWRPTAAEAKDQAA